MRFTNFTPHAMKVSEIRVTSYQRQNMCGILRSPFYVEELEFQSLTELLMLLENLQDELGYPEQTMELRSFHHKKATGPESDKPGGGEPPKQALASFKVSVFFRQNATWQGSVYWIEKDEVANFRSVFELIKLFDSALGRPEGSTDSSWAAPDHP